MKRERSSGRQRNNGEGGGGGGQVEEEVILVAAHQHRNYSGMCSSKSGSLRDRRPSSLMPGIMLIADDRAFHGRM